ncbi:MAG: glycosyltransferase family 2 protein [Desulfobacterales bacterium]
MKNAMKISLITVCRNSASTIENCIQSATNQNYPHLEYIIMDGGSTDGTVDIIKKYQNRITYWISEKDRGIFHAMNKGLQRASGDIIGFINADDFFASDDVLSEISAALENTDYDGVYSDLIYVDQHDADRTVRYWKSGEFSKKKMRFGWFPPHPTLYFRKSVYDRLGFFDDRMKMAADYDLMVRFLYQGNLRMKYLPFVSAKMRMGGVSNRNITSIIRSLKEFAGVWKKNGLQKPPFLISNTLLFRFFQLIRSQCHK